MNAVELARTVYEPIGGGGNAADGWRPDYQAYADHLADDVVLEIAVPAGTPLEREYHGKEAVIDFFSSVVPKLIGDPRPDEPLEFIGAGDRVLILGRESYTIVKNGARVRNKAYAVTLEFRSGLIVRHSPIGDLMEFVDVHRHG